MRMLTPVLSSVALFLLLGLAFPTGVTAQEAEETPQPGTVVFSQNKCPYENFPEINANLDSIFAPVLDELLAEGKILGWGVLTHAWGDEWNWNVYHSVESHRAFLNFLS